MVGAKVLHHVKREGKLSGNGKCPDPHCTYHRPAFTQCLNNNNEVAIVSDVTRGCRGIRTFPPWTYSPGHFPPGQFPLSFFTWCGTFPLYHRHPPIYNIKRSTVIVYKIDSAYGQEYG